MEKEKKTKINFIYIHVFSFLKKNDIALSCTNNSQFHNLEQYEANTLIQLHYRWFIILIYRIRSRNVHKKFDEDHSNFRSFSICIWGICVVILSSPSEITYNLMFYFCKWRQYQCTVQTLKFLNLMIKQFLV